jgi:hypothetical protein
VPPAVYRPSVMDALRMTLPRDIGAGQGDPVRRGRESRCRRRSAARASSRLRAARSILKRRSAPAKLARDASSARSSCARQATSNWTSPSVMKDRSRHARPRNRTAAGCSLSGFSRAISTSSAAASSRPTCGSSAAAARAARMSPPASARRSRVSGDPCAVTNTCSHCAGQSRRAAPREPRAGRGCGQVSTDAPARAYDRLPRAWRDSL